MSRFMNWACIGEHSTPKVTEFLSEKRSLHASLTDCIDWVEAWAQIEHGTVLLTNGTTGSCDIALRCTENRDIHHITVTNHVHPTILASATQSARYLSSIKGDPVTVEQVDIDPLLSLDPAEFASGLVEQLGRDTVRGSTVFIIEHITSRLGLRLPVEDVAMALDAASLPVWLVIDGAQATGIYRLAQPVRCDYLGCFHKYCNCPAGSGFLVMGRSSVDLVPFGAAALSRQYLLKNADTLPTVAAADWRECSKHLSALPVSGNHCADVIALRDELVKAVGSDRVTPNLPWDSPYRSHLVSYDCGEEYVAAAIWRTLHREGYQIGLDKRFLRVAFHHSISHADISALGDLLRIQFDKICHSE